MRHRSRKYLVKAWWLRGEMAKARRDHDGAEQARREALRGAEAIGSPGALWRTQAALGRVRAARGKPDAAHAALAAGRDVLRALVRSVHDSHLRAALDNDLAIRRVMDLGAVPAAPAGVRRAGLGA